ncbi:MAG TPA: phosphatase PAP2 family protein, partial [Bryobacteraceae bacterium]
MRSLRNSILLAAAVLPAAEAQVADFGREVLQDERRILSAPASLRPTDWKWLAPVGGAAVWLVLTDDRNMSERIHTDPLARDRARSISNAGTGVLAALPVFLAWRGWRDRDRYTSASAESAARAVTDTLVTAGMLRAVVRRERPDGGRSSFPSMHAGAAWAMASVLAHRYPGWLTKTVVYSLAGAVTASRVAASEHFPSDALLGSALGWTIGRFTAGTGGSPTHREPALSPAADRARAGSPYVPLDSWIYTALDRLAAFGLVPSQTSGLRPWTRAECLRQAREADGLLRDAPAALARESAGLVRALRAELEDEGRPRSGVVFESLYVRNGVIAGPVLDDSFHFGQTWSGDYGRPFGRGWNSYTGFTARAQSGAFFAYVNGEYQHAPAPAPQPLPIRQAIAQLDGIPVSDASDAVATDRFRALDAYIGARLG